MAVPTGTWKVPMGKYFSKYYSVMLLRSYCACHSEVVNTLDDVSGKT